MTGTDPISSKYGELRVLQEEVETLITELTQLSEISHKLIEKNEEGVIAPVDYDEMIQKYDTEVMQLKNKAENKIEKVMDILKAMRKFTDEEKKIVSDIKVK